MANNGKFKKLQGLLSELYHVRQTKKAIAEKEKLLSSQAITIMDKQGITKASFNSSKLATYVQSQKSIIDVLKFQALVDEPDFINSITVVSKQAKQVLSGVQLESISTITGSIKSIRIS